MIKITQANLKDHTPDELVEKLSGPGGDLAIEIGKASLPFLKELFGQIIVAIGKKKLNGKRIDTLEAAARAQSALNAELVARIAALEKK